MKKLIIIPLLLLFIFASKNDVIAENNIDYTNSENWDEWRLYSKDEPSIFVREFGTGDTITVLHGGWGILFFLSSNKLYIMK